MLIEIKLLLTTLRYSRQLYLKLNTQENVKYVAGEIWWKPKSSFYRNYARKAINLELERYLLIEFLKYLICLNLEISKYLHNLSMSYQKYLYVT